MPCPICASKKTCYFAKKDTYTFYRCRNCKTLFLSTQPSPRKLGVYYSKQFAYRDGLLNEAQIRKRSRVILKKIKNRTSHVKTLCDVGSGYGFFLDEAQKKGVKVFGIEPSQQLVHYAFQKHAIKSFLGTLKEYVKENREQFDVVTCIHVIEHVTEPKNFISDLLRLVKPGGILFIETPNSDSHLLYVEKENYTFLIPPEHLWIFSKDSFIYLIPRNSQIINANTYSYSEHLMGIVKQMVNNRKSSFQKRLPRRPPNRRIPRNDNTFRKNLSYFLFDRLLAPLFTGFLNAYHKGSILELYIKKN